METKEILRENGTIKAKVKTDKYGTELYTSSNGWQWTGVTLTPELARLTIEVLKEYLHNG